MTESLVDLDLGARLIAVADACTRPAAVLDHLPRLGDPRWPDVGRLLALAPDLVFVSTDWTPPSQIDALRRAGLALWDATPRSLFETLNLLWDLMHVFDHTAMVPRVQAIERAYDAARGASQAQAPVRVLAAFGPDPWHTVQRETYADDVLRVCGGANVFADRDDPVITLDDVAAAQPEVALLLEEPGARRPDEAARALAALDIPAARAGCVYRIDASLLTWPGTRAAYALRDLPALLMPPLTES